MCDKAFFFQIGLAYTNLKDINKKLSHLRTAFYCFNKYTILFDSFVSTNSFVEAVVYTF